MPEYSKVGRSSIGRAIVLAAPLVLAVGLSACGSGGATSSGDATAGNFQSPAEAAWAQGVQQEVADFMAHSTPSHLGTHNRHPIEMSYSFKSTETRSAFFEVERVLTPPTCKKAQEEVLDAIKRLGNQTEELVGKHDLSRDEYAALYDRQAKKVDEAGRELTDLASSLTCEGSGSTDSEPTAESIAEAGWIQEVTMLVREFELQKHTPQDPKDQGEVEALYGFESLVANMRQFDINELRMPASCEETRGEILDVLAKIEKQRKALDRHSDLNEKEYFALLRERTEEIDESERELRDLTSPITC